MSPPPAGSLAYWTGERTSTWVITSMLSLWPASIGTGATLRKSPGGYTPDVDDQRRRGRELPERKES
jgi:hypothetical protein